MSYQQRDKKSWYNQHINNKQSMLQMSNDLSKVLKRKLTIEDMTNLKFYINAHSNHNWNLTIASRNGDALAAANDIRRVIVKNLVQHKYTPKGRNDTNKYNDTVDLHETMKAMLGKPGQEVDYSMMVNTDGTPINSNITPSFEGEEEEKTLGDLNEIKTVSTISQVNLINDIKSIWGKRTDFDIRTLLNPEANYRTIQISLDTRYRSTGNDGTKLQTWDFVTDTAVTRTGSVNSIVGNISNVVSISVGRIRIPYKDIIVNNNYRRVSMLINEFSNQAVIGHEGRRYHFLFESIASGNAIELYPIAFNDNDTAYHFTKPITQISTITTTWGNPMEQIIFDKDRLFMTITHTNPGRFTSTEEHNLLTGDIVYFTDFTTDDTISDEKIIEQVNSVNGHNIVKVDDFSFDIDDLDLTAVTAPTAGLNVIVYFGANRIIIPLTIKYTYTN
jgi:hypothetical protein